MNLISQKVSFTQISPNLAVYEGAGYACNDGLKMYRIRYEELKDDIYDRYRIGLSDDNGKTWAEVHHWEAGELVEGGVRRRLFLQGGNVMPNQDLLVMMGMEGVLRSDHPLDGMTHYYPICMTSIDAGQTWNESRPIQEGEEFNEEHPFKSMWIGKNAIMPANVPIVTRDGRLLVPCNVTTLGPDGEDFAPEGARTFTVAGVMIGTVGSGGRFDWHYGKAVHIPPEQSLRGAVEPALAEMQDGRVLMVLRANDGTVEKQGGRKWFSISHDGGRTWSPPGRWTYSDGTSFYSPSSISILLWHTSGDLYWFGNICLEQPKGNCPRYPLVVGRVNPDSLLLEKESVFTIDTRKEGDSDSLQLSNFCVYEDRPTGNLILHMTRWDGKPSGGVEATEASVHLYRIEI